MEGVLASGHHAKLIEPGMTPQIWIQQVGGTALRLTNGEQVYSHLSFSADDTRILFTASDAAGRMCTRCRRSAANRACCCEARTAASCRPMVSGSCPFRAMAREWVVVDRSATYPFWSADGRLLYYTPIGTNPMVRSAIRARHFASVSGLLEGEPRAVYAAYEMMMPAYLPGMAPIATPDQIVLVLGDFRGDVWMMDLDPHSNWLAGSSG